jgi:hypothetical protein
MTIVDDGNRVEIQRKYIDYLISHMDFMEVRKELWHYLNREKDKYSNYSLELEISRDAPEVLDTEQSCSLYLGGYQNA